MNIRLIAVICAFFVLGSVACGQRTRMPHVWRYIDIDPRSVTYGETIVVLPRYMVIAEPEMSQKDLYDLSRRFRMIPKDHGIVAISSDLEKPSRFGIEESAVFEFGMRGKELKALKGGFELAGMDFYLKSGLAWHPAKNRNVTFTLGKRTTFRYSYWNFHDVSMHVIRDPIMFFNDRVIERYTHALLDRIFGH